MGKDQFDWTDYIFQGIFLIGWLITLPFLVGLLFKHPDQLMIAFFVFWMLAGPIVFYIVARDIKKKLGK